MIRGNKLLKIEALKDSLQYDKNGKKIVEWSEVLCLKGWLDLISGDSKYDNKAKIEDSTHIFLSDYVNTNIDIEIARGILDGKVYDIKYVDNPMFLNEQLEIYLKLKGENDEV